MQVGGREISEEATASNSNKRGWGHGRRGSGGQRWNVQPQPISAASALTRAPHSQYPGWAEKTACNSARALGNFTILGLYPSCTLGQECPFQLWLLGKALTLPPRLSSVSPPRHACLLAPCYPGMAELLLLYHSTHRWLAFFCLPQRKRSQLTTEAGPPDSKELLCVQRPVLQHSFLLDLSCPIQLLG